MGHGPGPSTIRHSGSLIHGGGVHCMLRALSVVVVVVGGVVVVSAIYITGIVNKHA